MRSHALDTANGAAAGSFILATLGGWTVQEWAAAAALIYSLLLIADKLGLLAPFKALAGRFFRWSWAQVVAAGRLASRARQ